MIPLGVMGAAHRNNSWTPASLSGLTLWLDAADASTLTTSGGTVTQWRDKSTYPRHASPGRNGPPLRHDHTHSPHGQVHRQPVAQLGRVPIAARSDPGRRGHDR